MRSHCVIALYAQAELRKSIIFRYTTQQSCSSVFHAGTFGFSYDTSIRKNEQVIQKFCLFLSIFLSLNIENFVIPGLYLLIEVSYERAETELSRNVIFSLKFRYRPPNDFLVPSLQIDFNHSCMKYASYELHQMI